MWKILGWGLMIAAAINVVATDYIIARSLKGLSLQPEMFTTQKGLVLVVKYLEAQQAATELRLLAYLVSAFLFSLGLFLLLRARM